LILPIRKYPNQTLRKKAQRVEKITDSILALIDNMIETMMAADGLGLAANQVGSLKRIFVLNTSFDKKAPEPLVVINPEIIFQDEKEFIEEEGCLSFPELYLKISRPERVKIQAVDNYNRDYILDTSGILAKAVMHEIDHLNGVLFIDHIRPEEEKILQKYLKKIKPTVK